MCQSVVGTHALVTTDEERRRPDSSEVEVLLSDPIHAVKRISWDPRIDMEQGLKRTAAWLRERAISAAEARYYHR